MRDQIWLLIEDTLTIRNLIWLHLEYCIIERIENQGCNLLHIDLLCFRIKDFEELINDLLLEFEHLKAHEECDCFF